MKSKVWQVHKKPTSGANHATIEPLLDPNVTVCVCVSLDVAISKTFKGNSVPKQCDTLIYHFEINFCISTTHSIPFGSCSPELRALNLQIHTKTHICMWHENVAQKTRCHNPKRLHKRLSFHSLILHLFHLRETKKNTNASFFVNFGIILKCSFTCMCFICALSHESKGMFSPE